MLEKLLAFLFISVGGLIVLFFVSRLYSAGSAGRLSKHFEFDSTPYSPARLFAISVAGLFLELLMIRWVSSEVTIFAYFKNFVLIACFLGLGLGGHLSTRRINLLSLLAPVAYIALFVKLPWPALREAVAVFTSILGSSTEVDIWGVPVLAWDWTSISGLAATVTIVIPLFALLSMMFIPIGQLTARLLEQAPDGILAYTINVGGGLLGVLSFTGLCLFFEPPSVWLAVGGLLLMLAFGNTRWLATAVMATFAVAIALASTPDSNTNVQRFLLPFLSTGEGTTAWSPYQKLRWAPTIENGQQVAWQLVTNNSWYQQVIDLSDSHIAAHPELFGSQGAEWNPYNIAYHFHPQPRDALVLGAGMGNDVAAALRNGASHVTAVEIDPMILDLGRNLHPEHPYADPRVETVVDDARSFLQHAGQQYDFITFSLLDSQTTSSNYGNIRIDNYVYTREALAAVKRLLKPDGVLVVKFQPRQSFIAGRLKELLTETFGTAPLQFEAASPITAGTFFIAGDRQRIETAAAAPAMQQYLQEHGNIATTPAMVTTDDWPFFYQHSPGLSLSVILISVLLIVVSSLLLRQTAIPLRSLDWMFFCLGAGFMLMESLIVSRMALLFGTTWLVNSITISGLLLLIMAANMLERADLRIPTPVVCAGLFVSLFVAWAVPVAALLSAGLLQRLAGGIGVLCSPVFFASILFIRTFARARFTGSALGSNVLGALVGGLLESLSMWVGYKALLILTALLYLCAILLSRRRATLPSLMPVAGAGTG